MYEDIFEGHMGEKSRRDVLKLGTVGVVAGLAGCANVLGESQSSSSPAESPSTGTATADPRRGAASISTENASRGELRNQIGKLEARLAELRSEVETKNETITSLEGDLTEKKSRIETLQGELDSLNATLESKTARVAELESSISEKNERISQLEDEVKSGSESSSKYSEAVHEQAKTVGKTVRQAVVVLSGEKGSQGTAWFHSSGNLITNSHVVEGQDSFTAWTIDGESFSPTLAGRSNHMENPYHDVAVLDTDVNPDEKLSLGDSTELERGQPLVQVGHPIFVGNWVVSIGEYVKLGFGDSVLSTVPGQSGVSGGPLVDLDGNVVGITTGAVDRDQGSSNEGAPEPVAFKVNEELPNGKYATHDTTAVIEQYIEKHG